MIVEHTIIIFKPFSPITCLLPFTLTIIAVSYVSYVLIMLLLAIYIHFVFFKKLFGLLVFISIYELKNHFKKLLFIFFLKVKNDLIFLFLRYLIWINLIINHIVNSFFRPKFSKNIYWKFEVVLERILALFN